MKTYKIEHKSGQDYWQVTFNGEPIMAFRAKSRSKKEMQLLLDHMNQQFKKPDTDI
jgi:hypothetical protein